MNVAASFAVLLASTALTIGTARSARMPGTIVPWLAQATHEGTVADADAVTVALYLPLRNEAALRQLIADQADPSSSRYGQYLSPAQFHAQYAPDASDTAKVVATLRSLGFTIGTVPDSGLYVEATATAATVRQAFGVRQDWYAYKGRLLRATSVAPTLPASLDGLVVAIAGLDDGKRLRTPDNRRLGQDRPTATPALTGPLPAAAPPVADSIPSPYCSNYYGDQTAKLSTAPAPYAAKQPWLVCGYTPQQVRQAYGVDKTFYNGLFATVAIIDTYASPTIVYDVNRYSAHYGLPPLITGLNYRQIVPAGIYNVPSDDPCGPGGWYGEETLDHEAVHSMAPYANIVYAGDSCTDPVNTALYTIIDHRYADIITNSYSYGGEDVSADQLTGEEELFEQAAAEGISVLFSSGDDGDLIAANGTASGTWDATSPYVTAVGGTSLALYDKSGSKDEWGWGNYRAYLANATVNSESSVTTSGLAAALTFYAGSGGGPSLVWEQPAYQAAVVPATYADTTTYETTSGTLATENLPFAPDRVTPDISMVADPYTGFSIGETYTTSGSPITDSGCSPLTSTTEYCFGSIGGTSLSSPLFAGVLALVDEARLLQLRKPVGFVNPALYAMSVGKPGSTSQPIVDVRPPATPSAVLRGYLGSPTEIRLVTMNSTLAADGTTVLEGADTSYTTAKGYDQVTGLGTPYVPALISAFTAFR